MKLTKSIVAITATLVATAAMAGDSAPFLLDTRAELAVKSSSIAITYDAAWIGGDAGATVVISDNGVEVKRTTGAGEFSHTLSGIGRHALTYVTYINGIAQEEIFNVVIDKNGGSWTAVFSTSTNQWFDTQIESYHVWPTNNVEAFGGEWRGTENAALTDDGLEVGGSLSFIASEKKDLSDTATRFFVRLGMSHFFWLPDFADGDKARICTLKKSDDTEPTVHIMEFDSALGTNVWFDTGLVCSGTIACEVLLGKSGDPTYPDCIAVTYKIGTTYERSVLVRVYGGDSTVEEVDFSGVGKLSSLSATFVKGGAVDCTYSVNGDGIVITGVSSARGDVVIPSEIDGGLVTGVGTSAFAGCSGLTSVTIPDNVWNIGDGAFAGCTSLRRVEAAIGLKRLLESGDFFADCPDDLEIVYHRTAEIRNVVAKQRKPWNGKVDITFELEGNVAAGFAPYAPPAIIVSAEDSVAGTNYVAVVGALSGDVGTEEGLHHVIWDLNAQGLELKSDDMTFTVSYGATGKYCVIDLSGGANASSYPVTYLADVPAGGWTDEYKTTKLVLRRIEPGSFKMGGQYDVTLTKPYYMGVFEVTQKQYELVTGSNPSQYKGDMRPVEKVSWDMIRGNSSTYNWPNSTAVDPNSFMGRIQACTGLGFDLPTEAQWEYACRAGTTSTYNNGGETEGDLKLLGRYNGNRSDGMGGYTEHTTAGSYLPNVWGLYDMHGNVWEWCLDKCGDLSNGVADPVGAGSSSYQIVRGGGWSDAVSGCSITYRPLNNQPSAVYNYIGFRLARTVSDLEGVTAVGAGQEKPLCSADSVAVAIDSRTEAQIVTVVDITWDASWIGGDAGATVVIADNGTEIGRKTGAGEFKYALEGEGRHNLTYTTLIDDVAQEEFYFNTVFKDWKYEVVNGTATITETSQDSGELVVPSEIDGYTVTGIGDGVFAGCSRLVGITIPEGVTSIGAGVFEGCSGLTSVTMPYRFRTQFGDTLNGCEIAYIATVRFEAEGEEVHTRYVACGSAVGELAEFESPVGYTLGWYTASDGGVAFSADTIVTEDITLYARWIANEYQVAFDAAGGVAEMGGKTVTYDGVYGELPTASCDGYVFLGWMLDGVDIGADTVVKTSENHTLTAKWGIQVGNGIWAATICDEPITLGAPLVPPSGEVTIPATIAGRPVVGVTDEAFAGNTAVTWVTVRLAVDGVAEGVLGDIPLTVVVDDDGQYIADAIAANVRKVVFADGVTRIHDNYFRLGEDGHAGRATLPNLETIDIAESVVRIGTNVFEACSALETETIGGFVMCDGWVLRRDDGGVSDQGGGSAGRLALPDGIRGIAAGAFEGEYGIETAEFPSTLRFVGAGAFSDCTGIEDVTLPEGVVAVDREAFRNCTYAQGLSLPSTLEEIGAGAFANCTSLAGVAVPDGVADIGGCAFSNCWRMLSAAIPASVTNVGAGAFADCRRLAGVAAPFGVGTMAELFPAAYDRITSVQIADAQGRVPPMQAGMFAGCAAMERLTLPEGLGEVSEGAFAGCAGMAAFDLPESVTNIGARAFAGLELLAAFAFPTGVVAIGEEAFSGCAGMTALALPEGLERIGARAFQGLSLLARVDIPASVVEIGDAAFGGCGNVRAVSLPGDVATAAAIWPDTYNKMTSAAVTDGGRGAGAAMVDSIFEGCAALAHVELPTSLAAIGARAFAGCTSLTEAGIPSGVASLGAEVFCGCGSLSVVALPKGLSALPERAFAGCASLSEVVVPEGVASVGAGVFDGCALLRSVRFVGGNAPTCAAAAYGGTDAALVTYVARGSMGWDGIATSKSLPEFWPEGTAHEITWWEPNRFMVDFVAEGDGGVVTAQVEQVTGTTYVLPADAARRGAAFGGWWTAADGGARVTAVMQVALTRPHAFYAHWTFNRYAVLFDANGGEGEMAAADMTVATVAALPECGFSRAGYAFTGWAVEPDGEVVYADAAEVVDLAYAQGAAVTLYAVWEEHAWTLEEALCEGGVPCDGVRAVESSDWAVDLLGGRDARLPCARSGGVPAAEEGMRTNSTLTATVDGAGGGSFWWKVSCEEMDDEYGDWFDYAVFRIDGVEIARIAGESGWRRVEYAVSGAGAHTLEWTFTRDDYDEDWADWENAAWVGDLVWTPAPKVLTLGDAAGADAASAALAWTTGGDANWSIDATTGHADGDSAKSGSVASGQSSWIEVEVEGPGVATFRWNVMGGAYRGNPFAYAKVEVDGALEAQEHATDGWKEESVDIEGAGAHTIRWTYLRTSSRDAAGDCAWLDCFLWTPSCGHSTTNVVNAIAATCTEAGYTGDKVCGECGEMLEVGSPIPALGHIEGEGIVTKEPTTAEAGVMTYYCTRCGTELRTEAIPKTEEVPVITFGDTYRYHNTDWDNGGYVERDLNKSNYIRVFTDGADNHTHIALFEVLGASSKDEIKPVVENLGFKGTLETYVWTDEELRNAVLPPPSTMEEWESAGRSIDNREPGDISGPCNFSYYPDVFYEYESDNGEFSWPQDLWPDNKAVADRFWVAVECEASEVGRWGGFDGGFRVWQSETGVKSEQMFVIYETEDSWPCATNLPSLFRGVPLTNSDRYAFDIDIWDVIHIAYGVAFHGFWLESEPERPGAPLQITLPEAGILYMTDYEGDLEGIDVENADSVEVEKAPWNEWPNPGYPREEYFYQSGSYWPNRSVLAAKVNSARTIRLVQEDEFEDYGFNRFQFFPSASKSVAVEASFVSILDKNRYPRSSGENVGEYLQGYVTGTGVYKVGETVALTAVAAPGEEFDHWELKYGNFPEGIDTTKTNLNFVVTDACAGTAEERKQMVVRAVWKAKRQIVATMDDVARGRVSGSGFYLDGTSVTLTAQPAAGYEFVEWSDGVKTATRTVSVSGDAEYLARFRVGSGGDLPVTLPSVADDPSAVVTGDAESGFVVKPSAASGAVEVTIPSGVDAAKVTVEVAPTVEVVKPNGANVKVKVGAHDITEWLDIPQANANGVIDMTKAEVKQTVADEAMDSSKGATFGMEGGVPALKTSATKPGLKYTLREGTTLGTMADGATKQGDGEPWTPLIKVKDGASGFYTIKVGK